MQKVEVWLERVVGRALRARLGFELRRLDFEAGETALPSLAVQAGAEEVGEGGGVGLRGGEADVVDSEGAEFLFQRGLGVEAVGGEGGTVGFGAQV